MSTPKHVVSGSQQHAPNGGTKADTTLREGHGGRRHHQQRPRVSLLTNDARRPLRDWQRSPGAPGTQVPRTSDGDGAGKRGSPSLALPFSSSASSFLGEEAVRSAEWNLHAPRGTAGEDHVVFPSPPERAPPPNLLEPLFLTLLGAAQWMVFLEQLLLVVLLQPTLPLLLRARSPPSALFVLLEPKRRRHAGPF